MKKVTFILVLLYSGIQMHAQSISAEALSNSGGTYTSTIAILTFTEGQIMNETFIAGGISLMQGFQQQYTTYWTASTSNAWLTGTNWNGGPTPDANTDVIILSPVPFYPVISSNVFCRSIGIKPGATVTVNAPNTLTVTH